MHLENCPALLCVNDLRHFRVARYAALLSHYRFISYTGAFLPETKVHTQAWFPHIPRPLFTSYFFEPAPTSEYHFLRPVHFRSPPPISVSHFQILEEKK